MINNKAYMKKYNKKPEQKARIRNWKRQNKEKILAQKERYRNKHKEELKEINLIRIHSTRGIKPILISKYGGCQFCKSTEKLEIHHNKYTTNLEDIMLLCRKCHLDIHKRSQQEDLKTSAI